MLVGNAFERPKPPLNRYSLAAKRLAKIAKERVVPETVGHREVFRSAAGGTRGGQAEAVMTSAAGPKSQDSSRLRLC